MKLEFVYGNKALVLPAIVTDVAANASANDFRVLCAFAKDQALCHDLSFGVEAVAKELSLTAAAVEASLAFWRGAGVITQTAAEQGKENRKQGAEKAMKPTKAAKPVPDRGLPTYSTEELADIVEGNKDFGALIAACQQTFGKIFNTAEVNIIAGLTDYLGLEGDYILLLLLHCVRMEKKSLRYAEKTALSLYDDGITDASALEERLQRIEMMASATGKIRTVFGASSRALPAKEKKMIEQWVCVMKYDIEVIRLAYDATVDAIQKPSFSYANTILERWHAAGYKTVEDVNRAMEEYRRQKLGGSSFDVDDFFSAALKNTYGEV